MKARLILFPDEYPEYFAVIRSGSRPGQEKETMVRRGPVMPDGERVYLITFPTDGPAMRFSADTTSRALAQIRKLCCDFVVAEADEAPPVQLSIATCEVCGEDFAQNHIKQKYCDATCGARANSDITIAAQRARSKTRMKKVEDPPPFLVQDFIDDERITARMIRQNPGCTWGEQVAEQRRAARRVAA